MPMITRDGRHVVREDVLLAWYKDRLRAWPLHRQRLKRGLSGSETG